MAIKGAEGHTPRSIGGHRSMQADLIESDADMSWNLKQIFGKWSIRTGVDSKLDSTNH